MACSTRRIGWVLAFVMGIIVGTNITMVLSHRNWRIQLFSTPSPTHSPTVPPTYAPTKAPTLNPTPSPTKPEPKSKPPPACIPKRHDVVISMAEGVEYEKRPGLDWVVRFGGSLQRTGSGASIHFFSSGLDPVVKKIVGNYNMHPFIFGNEEPPYNKWEVALRRWYLVHKFLLDRRDDLETSWVFSLDARDSFFQSDPFAVLPYPDDPNSKSPPSAEESGTEWLYVFEENPSFSIGTSSWNWDVLSSCYQQSEISPIRNFPILCSGTILGTYAAMLAFTQTMVEEAAERDQKPTCASAGGRDQGYHNFLIYSGKFEKKHPNVRVRRFSNEDGIVRTLGTGAHLYRDHATRVLFPNSKVAPVVHQYDRVRAITDMLFPNSPNSYMFPAFEEPELPPGYPEYLEVNKQPNLLTTTTSSSSL